MARLCDIDDCYKPHRARGLCSMHWKREHGTRTKYARTCEVCSTEYLSDRPTGRFCSDDCKAQAYRRSRALVGPVEPTLCWLPDRHPARRTQPKPRIWYAGSCAWCDDTFVDNQPGVRFCSPRCRRQADRSKYRFTVPMHVRLAIYERDRWTCQLCFDTVDSDLMTYAPQDDWAPSLDHVECQSWAQEPDHSPDNLRLAHRWCNAVRGDERYHTANDLGISPAA